MKILSCHIENYGKIHDLNLEFNEGINTICEENGWGKSTFASFVKAMFYGLPATRKSDVSENERKHYKPWQGGAFGGSIDFVIGDKSYKLTRLFGNKESEDEFELRDGKTNLISNDYSANIGEEIFKLDAASFARTVFIGQSDIPTQANGSINAKVGNVAASENDINRFENADAVLKDLLNSMSPTRATGSIKRRKGEITELKQLIRNDNDIETRIELAKSDLKLKEEEIDGINATIATLSVKQQDASERQAKYKDYLRLSAEAEALNRKVDNIAAKFPKGVPSDETMGKAEADLEEANKYKAGAAVKKLNENEIEIYNKCKEIFVNGIPSDEEIDEKINLETEASKEIQNVSSKLMSREEQERLKELTPYYENESSSGSALFGRWEERNRRIKNVEANMFAATASAPKKDSGKLNTASNAILFVGMLLVAFDIYYYIMHKTILEPLTIALMAAGLVCVVVAILLRSKARKMTEVSDDVLKIREQVMEDSKFIKDTDRIVKEYIEAHGFTYNSETVEDDLEKIADNRGAYKALEERRKIKASDEDLAAAKAKRNKVVAFLNAFGIYPEDGEILSKLYNLKSLAANYKMYKSKIQSYNKDVAEYNKKSEELNEFFDSIIIDMDSSKPLRLNLDHIKEVRTSYYLACDARDKAVNALSNFTKGITEEDLLKSKEFSENYDPEEFKKQSSYLARKLKDASDEKVDLQRNIEDLNATYDAWEENQAKLKELSELNEVETVKFNRLAITKEYLTKARNAFTSKYTEPIRQNFGKYYEVISGRDISEINVDSETKVTVTEQGKQRDTDYLSAGYKDLIGFSLRMALADVMYKDEKPVLIMDDPFTNLDDEKLLKGKEVLERIGEDYQVIYLTCSNVR